MEPATTGKRGVEFSDDNGRAYAMAALKEEQLIIRFGSYQRAGIYARGDDEMMARVDPSEA